MRLFAQERLNIILIFFLTDYVNDDAINKNVQH